MSSQERAGRSSTTSTGVSWPEVAVVALCWCGAAAITFAAAYGIHSGPLVMLVAIVAVVGASVGTTTVITGEAPDLM